MYFCLNLPVVGVLRGGLNNPLKDQNSPKMQQQLEFSGGILLAKAQEMKDLGLIPLEPKVFKTHICFMG